MEWKPTALNCAIAQVRNLIARDLLVVICLIDIHHICLCLFPTSQRAGCAACDSCVGELNQALERKVDSKNETVSQLQEELKSLQLIVSENIERRETVEHQMSSVKKANVDLEENQLFVSDISTCWLCGLRLVCPMRMFGYAVYAAQLSVLP